MSPIVPSLRTRHEVAHVADMGWQSIKNGELLRRADETYDLLITVDKNMPFQSSLKGLSLIVVVLNIPNRAPETFERYLDALEPLLETYEPGTFNVLTVS